MSTFEEFAKGMTDEELDAPSTVEERNTAIDGLLETIPLITQAKEAYRETNLGGNAERVYKTIGDFDKHIDDVRDTAIKIKINENAEYTPRKLLEAMVRIGNEAQALRERAT